MRWSDLRRIFFPFVNNLSKIIAYQLRQSHYFFGPLYWCNSRYYKNA